MDTYYIEAMKEINIFLGLDEWDGLEREYKVIEYRGRLITMAGRTSSTGPR